jgi:hypothetical protein
LLVLHFGTEFVVEHAAPRHTIERIRRSRITRP